MAIIVNKIIQAHSMIKFYCANNFEMPKDQNELPRPLPKISLSLFFFANANLNRV